MDLRKTTGPSATLFGRGDLLDWLDRVIFAARDSDAVNDCALVLLHGSRGMGKSTICRVFVEKHLRENPAVQPFVVFEWKAGTNDRSPLRFSRLLFQMGRSNLPLREPLERPAQGSGSERNGGGESTEHAKQTYREDGLPEESSIPENLFSAQNLTALAEEFVNRINAWLGGGVNGVSTQMKAATRILFVLDNFENYQAPVRQWIGRYLLPLVQSPNGLPHTAFLFTGERPWEKCEFADYWEVAPGNFYGYQMNPLGIEDSKEWLLSAGLSTDLLEVLIEETEGNPARVAALISEPDRLKALHLEGNLDGQLSMFSAKQRRWLHAASMREIISRESLEIILGREEAAHAFAWLRQNLNYCQIWARQDGTELLKIDPELRKEILRLALDKIPIRHDNYSARLQIVDELAEQVPLQDHRKALRLLAPIKPLTEDAIRYVYGED